MGTHHMSSGQPYFIRSSSGIEGQSGWRERERRGVWGREKEERASELVSRVLSGYIWTITEYQQSSPQRITLRGDGEIAQ